ncbi:MAG: transcriptional regulator, partial [Eggerthella lenta]
LMAIVEKVLEKPLAELPGTVLDLAESVGTDMNTSDILSLALDFSGGSGEMTVYSCTGPSNGDFMEQHNGLWFCYENPEGWANLMAAVDAGEDPGELDVESTAIIPASSDASV